MLCLFSFLPDAGKNQTDKENIDMRPLPDPELWNARILEDIKRGRPLPNREKNALASRG
jgi:hypothetical protein